MSNAPLTILLVDDEKRSRDLMRIILNENCADVEVIGEADGVKAAIEKIDAVSPQLVFLDIEMGEQNGFQLLEHYTNPNFKVVFATAYDDYALKAFECSAIDYILKPYNIEQVKKAVDKAKAQLGSTGKENIEALKMNLATPNHLSRLALPIADGFLFVEPSEIVYFEAESSYTRIHLHNGQKVLVSRGLKDFVEIVDLPYFYKPHRSYYINLNRVRQYNKSDGGEIIMDNGATVYAARDKKEEFLQAIGAIQSGQ
jgi:two-component system, LytTR family, response regulator